jgi:low affinity Fe/Cu permease
VIVDRSVRLGSEADRYRHAPPRRLVTRDAARTPNFSVTRARKRSSSEKSPHGAVSCAAVSFEDRPAASARGADDTRSPFDRFVEAAYKRVSKAPFFFICLLVVLIWLLSAPLWADLKAWQVAIHTVTSVVTLLLIALLENANRRDEEAAQEKLNVLAEALAALMESRAIEDPNLEEAHKRLSDAVGLEERH